MFKPCDSDFNLERHLIPYLQDCAFFAEISRHLRKVATRDMPTAAIGYDPKHDEICLYYNPEFFQTMTNWEIRGVLTHEFYHVIFGHLNFRRRTPPMMWNVATDLAINSLIYENAGRPRDLDEEEFKNARPLPACALVPGKWPVKPDGRELSKDEKQGAKLAALIAGFPKMMASEWYFQKLQEEKQKNQKNKQKGEGQGQPGEGDEGSGDDWLDGLDDHSAWDEIPEDMREYIEGKVKSIVEKAVKHADQQSQGWGNIPADMREAIRKSVSNIVNWRMVLRQFIGSLVRGARTTSIKRINRRYPYIHPGIKRGYTAKLLIAMDQSGSVYNEMLVEFFSELSALTKKVDITLLPFDCTCDEHDLVEWKRGMTPKIERVKGGGTDFSAPTHVFNDPKNRGRWDGLLILTDGGADKPIPCRAKRGWILGKGTKLMFQSDEMQIYLDKEKPMSGAWRTLTGDDLDG